MTTARNEQHPHGFLREPYWISDRREDTVVAEGSVVDVPVHPMHVVDVFSEPDGSAVRLVGRLDVHTVADVRAALQQAIDSGTGALVVDVRETDVYDATGLGVLMGMHRRALRADRTLVLRNVPERLGRLLRATRLDRVLYIEAAAEHSLV